MEDFDFGPDADFDSDFDSDFAICPTPDSDFDWNFDYDDDDIEEIPPRRDGGRGCKINAPREHVNPPRNLLEAFESIVTLSSKSRLSHDFFEEAAVYIEYATKKLDLTPVQVVILAYFLEHNNDAFIGTHEVARHLGLHGIGMLRHEHEFEALSEKRYIRPSRGHGNGNYHIPRNVVTSLRNNKPSVFRREKIEDTGAFFDRYNELMGEMRHDGLTYDELQTQVDIMLTEIKDSVFATELRKLELKKSINSDEFMILIFMAHLFVENSDDNITVSDIREIFSDGDRLSMPGALKRSLLSHKSKLFDLELIENVNDRGMARCEAFKLTDKVKDELLCELPLKKVVRNEDHLIQASSLVEMTLFYNPEEEKTISEMTELLSKDRFKDVQSQLRNANMRPGVCCLLYGAPGTGKTETVNQLARQTGRNIMRVDVDKIKNCFVGESEKRIKAAFNAYRNLCKDNDLAPILLFNEADALLGVRMEHAASPADKMENSIQNIILQEMESLEGIMIATTNLTSNLDDAFDRRFLYKVHFEKPSVEARSHIWQTMMKDLTPAQAKTLAEKFDFSGGEIENVVRKRAMQAILKKEKIADLDKIIEVCKQERICKSKRSSNKIGF